MLFDEYDKMFYFFLWGGFLSFEKKNEFHLQLKSNKLKTLLS